MFCSRCYFTAGIVAQKAAPKAAFFNLEIWKFGDLEMILMFRVLSGFVPKNAGRMKDERKTNERRTQKADKIQKMGLKKFGNLKIWR
jgi:hypothetical protein